MVLYGSGDPQLDLHPLLSLVPNTEVQDLDSKDWGKGSTGEPCHSQLTLGNGFSHTIQLQDHCSPFILLLLIYHSSSSWPQYPLRTSVPHWKALDFQIFQIISIPTCLANVSGLFLRGQPYVPTHIFCARVQPSVPWKGKTVPDRSTSIPKLLFHWEGAILSVLPVFLDLRVVSSQGFHLPLSCTPPRVCSHRLPHFSQDLKLHYYKVTKSRGWHYLLQEWCTIQNWLDRQELIISQLLLLE